ncbi:MAG: glycosyltransferase family 4 protein, partial [Bacteriovoracaceae bacterium]|nr:glycosyltransferase family 4 protein [Bacteriovoracaceae bacterium]
GGHLGASEDFDVIHAHDWMTFLAGIEAKKVSGKPLVVHVHATEFDRSGEFNNPDIYSLEKYGMQQADQVVTVSHRMKNIIVHKYGIDPNKVQVVYNAVEKDDMSQLNQLSQLSAKRNKIVLFLGRITMQKGPEYFIEAANIVLQKMQNVHFVMAGSGDMATKMIEKMAAMRMIDRFHFTGFLKEPERERLFAMSDLYIMPSVSEPFGITPLEAMKHDIPVIISKQSGIAEILGDSVIKIDFWDTHKLAQAIIDVLSNPQMTQTMIENNRRTLEQIDWKYSAQHLLDVYRKLL